MLYCDYYDPIVVYDYYDPVVVYDYYDPIIIYDTSPTYIVYETLPYISSPFTFPEDAYKSNKDGSCYFTPIEYGIYLGWPWEHFSEKTLKTFGSYVKCNLTNNIYNYVFMEDYHIFSGMYHYQAFVKTLGKPQTQTIDFYSDYKLSDVYSFESKLSKYLI